MLMTYPIQTLSLVNKHWTIVKSTTAYELRKRYSGSLFGAIWIVLYPVLFLSVYLFLYLVVFKAKYPSFSTLESVIYIFSGLVPYIAFMEAVNTSAVTMKQNMHLIKNVILPTELIPIRVVAVAIVTQFVGLAMVLVLCMINGNIDVNLLYLPIALMIQIMFLLGISMLISPIGLVLPDIGYFINIITLFLMFVSPIGFTGSMLSERMHIIIYLNPIYYMIDPFRLAFLPNATFDPKVFSVSVLMALVTFLLGSIVFKRFKDFLADYE